MATVELPPRSSSSITTTSSLNGSPAPNSPRKKAGKLVSESAKTREHTLAEKFADVFITKDLESVKRHLIFAVTVPRIKGLILDLIDDGFAMLFDVDRGRGGGRGSDPNYVSYNRGGYSNGKSSYNYKSGSYSDRRDDPYDALDRVDYRDVTYKTKDDADKVLFQLKEDAASEYGHAILADFFSYSGVDASKTEFTDNDWGWRRDMLVNVEPRMVRVREDGVSKLKWSLPLPKPIPLR